MRCLKCGNELKDDEIMCSNCGYNRNNTVNQDNQFATRNIGVYNQNPVDQEEVDRRLQTQKEFDELVETYIGNKYYNFRKGSFSWCAFFFGPLYYLYRKLYAVAILLFLMIGGINFFFKITTQGRYDNIRNIKELLQLKGFNTYMIIYLLTFFVFYLFLGMTFKKFYFNEVIERIGKIKKDNPKLGFNQLTQLVKQKGGTNILAPIIAILLPIIIILILMLIGFDEFGILI